MIEPPRELQRHGIRLAETNLRPGQTIALPSKLIVTIFGAELLRLFDKKESQNAG